MLARKKTTHNSAVNALPQPMTNSVTDKSPRNIVKEHVQMNHQQEPIIITGKRKREAPKSNNQSYQDSIWAELKEKLPWHKNSEEKAKRNQFWSSIDVNNNKILSLAEVDKGIIDTLNLPRLFDLKPVILRAFNAAKNKVKSLN